MEKVSPEAYVTWEKGSIKARMSEKKDKNVILFQWTISYQI